MLFRSYATLMFHKGFALLNIYENEINDMERINHVIRFIGKIAEGIGEL